MLHVHSNLENKYSINKQRDRGHLKTVREEDNDMRKRTYSKCVTTRIPKNCLIFQNPYIISSDWRVRWNLLRYEASRWTIFLSISPCSSTSALVRERIAKREGSFANEAENWRFHAIDILTTSRSIPDSSWIEEEQSNCESTLVKGLLIDYLSSNDKQASFFGTLLDGDFSIRLRLLSNLINKEDILVAVAISELWPSAKTSLVRLCFPIVVRCKATQGTILQSWLIIVD